MLPATKPETCGVMYMDVSSGGPWSNYSSKQVVFKGR